MEDVFSVAYQPTEDEKNLEYAFFGIFDGHSVREAATFAKVSPEFIFCRKNGVWNPQIGNCVLPSSWHSHVFVLHILYVHACLGFVL